MWCVLCGYYTIYIGDCFVKKNSSMTTQQLINDSSAQLLPVIYYTSAVPSFIKQINWPNHYTSGLILFTQKAAAYCTYTHTDTSKAQHIILCLIYNPSLSCYGLCCSTWLGCAIPKKKQDTVYIDRYDWKGSIKFLESHLKFFILNSGVYIERSTTNHPKT